MLNKDNELDKQRFEKLKEHETKRGRPEDEAIEIAADEVKVLREREGRAKEDGDPAPDEKH